MNKLSLPSSTSPILLSSANPTKARSLSVILPFLLLLSLPITASYPFFPTFLSPSFPTFSVFSLSLLPKHSPPHFCLRALSTLQNPVMPLPCSASFFFFWPECNLLRTLSSICYLLPPACLVAFLNQPTYFLLYTSVLLAS